MTLRVCRCLQRGPATQRSAVPTPHIHVPADPSTATSRLCKDGAALWEAHTVFAEASVIPGTVFDLRLRVNVQEWTFLVTAFPCTKANTLLSQLCRLEISMTLKALPGSPSSHRAVTNICKLRHNSLTACLNLHEELQGLTPGEPSSTTLDYLCF